MNKETLSTSEKEVPKTRLALQEKYHQEKKDIEDKADDRIIDSVISFY